MAGRKTFSSYSNKGGKLGQLFTKSKPFEKLVEKAYRICDTDGSGSVEKSELYAGLLLVHLNLAKYAGPAACYPPSRQQCNAMFEAADADNSGSIDQDEFLHIMTVLCAQIMGRIVVYYIVLILLVPIVAAKMVLWMGILEGSYLELAAHQATSLALFFVIIPLVWNKIDEQSHQQLKVRQEYFAMDNDLELSVGVDSKHNNTATSGRSLLL